MSSYAQAGGRLPQHSTRRIAGVHHSELKMPNCWTCWLLDSLKYGPFWWGQEEKWLKCQRLPCSFTYMQQNVCGTSMFGVWRVWRKSQESTVQPNASWQAFAGENLYITTNMQEEPASPERRGWSLITSPIIKLSTGGGHNMTEPACTRWTCQLAFKG